MNFATSINNLSRFKNWHKYHAINKTNIILFALARVCVCVSRGRSIPNHINFGLRKTYQNPNSLHNSETACVYKSETPVIIIP